MAKYAAVSRQRVTPRRVVAEIALLTIAVLVSAPTPHNPTDAAETPAPAPAFGGGSTPWEASRAGSRQTLSSPTAAPLGTQSAPRGTQSAAPVERAFPTAAPRGTQSAAPVERASPTAAPRGTQSAAPVEQASPTAVPPASTPDPAPSAEAMVTGRTMYATESVNVRNAPGTNGTSVLVVLNSHELVAAGDPVDGWTPVHAGDFHGWVSSGYLADGTPPEPAAVAARAESADNWMEALIPQVDPTGTATWVFRRNGSWGASDGHTNYIDPGVPADKRFSVMVHELSHVMQVQVYGSLTKAVAAMSAITGSSPSDVSSNEQTADCMALMLGATWINYGCPDSLRGAAAAILAGHRP